MRTKQELGRLLGREITGAENMHALLSEVLRKKTLAFVSEESAALPVPILPLFLSILLFFTLYPVMSFLVPLIAALVGIFFALLRRLKWLPVAVVTAEREVIEH